MIDIAEVLRPVFDGSEILTNEPDLTHYGQDWSRYLRPNPSAIVFPKEQDQIIELVRLARTRGLKLVPSGGRTGLSGGATACDGEVVVSFERMRAIIDYIEEDQLVRLQPGCITATLQNFAEDQGLFYPVDFASAGSSQVGGNIATNAGGIKVLRYGLTRAWVAGLSVVTGQGEAMTFNAGLMKNATGPDLQQLFIGSEGIFGMVTQAWMRLTAKPQSLRVMVLGVQTLEDTLRVLKVARQNLAVTAFEFFSKEAANHVTQHLGESSSLPDAPFFVLIEYETRNNADDAGVFTFDALYREGIVVDGILSQSERENAALWRYREGISEAITPRTPYKHDLSVSIHQAPAFLKAVNERVRQSLKGVEVIWFGHIGDGNVHLNLLRPEGEPIEEFQARCEPVGDAIMSIVQAFGGSVSAEHGIGQLKKRYLKYTRSEAEVNQLRSLKLAFDPDGVMNPGKVIDV